MVHTSRNTTLIILSAQSFVNKLHFGTQSYFVGLPILTSGLNGFTTSHWLQLGSIVSFVTVYSPLGGMLCIEVPGSASATLAGRIRLTLFEELRIPK